MMDAYRACQAFFGAQTVMTLLLTRTIEIESPKVFSVKCFLLFYLLFSVVETIEKKS